LKRFFILYLRNQLLNDTILRKITFLALLLASIHSSAQIVNTAPYILTVDELKSWTETGSTASSDLISTVPLATRFTNTQTQFNPELNNNLQIAYLPDGMNNFGNYFGEQSQFNLYNFTHWAYIDKFVWFGGTSSQTIQIPSSPWANAAHKNGVKIYGDVFFSPTAFGGSTATLQNFLEKDTDGHFIAVPKMIAIMQYYKFDGWFINQETATTPEVAVLMQEFVKELTTRAEAVGKEIMWYDAMLLNGNVGWQNRLNANNSPFVQANLDGNAENGFEQRISSSIFINFFWNNVAQVIASRTQATTIGRSSFDVFTGADIWPGRNQGNFMTTGNTFMTKLHETGTSIPITSLGLFATNCVYNSSVFTNFNNDPSDVDSFYDAENHLFAGADSNPGIVDATGFKGLSAWVPETSVITGQLETNFNTGHGKQKFGPGVVTSTESWHDMNEQDILPTWQWAFSQNGILTAKWDFDDAFYSGNSLKISGNLPANTPIDLMLFKTKFPVPQNLGTQVTNVFFKCANPEDSKMKLLVVFADDPTQKYEFPLNATPWPIFNDWASQTIALSGHGGREVAMLGLRFYSETAIPDYSINIGEFTSQEALLFTQEQTTNPQFIIVSYPNNNSISFTINWKGTDHVNYTIFDLSGKTVKKDVVKLNKTTRYTLDTSGLSSGSYIVKFTDKNNISETKKIIIR